MESAVRLRAAVTLLGRFPALAGVDLDISPGEIVLLKGPNGAGKTTLLRLCAGLCSLASGQGWVLGHDLSEERRMVRRRVALLGHRTGLYDDLTVAENVGFWAQAAGASRKDVDEALERLSLTGRLADTRVGRLSAGQRRRASIASLAVRRPELWLLDEPHAGLDQQTRDTVDTLVRGAAAAGATVVLATHELERIAVLKPRVLSVVGGVVRAGDELADPQSPNTPSDVEDDRRVS
ncbi:MAG: heme ABC exporter ATP-binding protein CcmA [bacterium]|nr:heme ABC exporter ATP-binding protein CcmA [bacterium]